MKTITKAIICCATLLTPFLGTAQDDNGATGKKEPPSATRKDISVDYGTYKWTTAIPMVKCKLNGDEIDDGDNIVESVSGQIFVIYNATLTGEIIIKIVSYEDDYSFFTYNFRGYPSDYYSVYQIEVPNKFLKSENKRKVRDSIIEVNKSRKVDHGSYGGKQLYFKVKASDLLKYAIKANYVKGGLSIGIINFPFKFRPQVSKQDFSSAFNMNTAVGYTLRRKEESDWQHSFMLGVGISSLSLDTSVVENNANKGKLEPGNTYSAITFSTGYMLQYQKAQVGLFMGVDRLSNLFQQQFDWKHQGNVWFSLGVGYAIFTPQKPQTSSSESQ